MASNQIIDVKPKDLHRNERNPRAEVTEVDDAFVQSIKSLGIIQPLVAFEDDKGRYVLRAGERRKAAAIKAGLRTVPVILCESEGDAADVAVGLVENIHREGLTEGEVAGGVQEMLELGVTSTEIVKQTGLPRDFVGKAKKAGKALDETKAAIAADAVTLDEALSLMQLEAHPELYAEALAAVGTNNFEYTVSRALRAVEFNATVEATKAECVKNGIAFLEPEDFDPDKHCRTSRFGAKVSDKHASADCHAVTVSDGYSGVTVIDVCVRPRNHDANAKLATDDMTDEEREAKKAERRVVIDSNKSGEAANDARRAWINKFLARKTFDKDAIQYIAARMAIREFSNDMRGQAFKHFFGDKSWFNVTDDERATLDKTPNASIRFLLAVAIEQAEFKIDKGFWRSSRKDFAEHLATLASWGFPASDFEIEFAKGHGVEVKLAK